MSAEILIQAETLTKTFGPLTAVDSICISVHSGEIYGLVGPDGAGKTTTLRLLCGALKPDSGQATIAGFSVTQQPEQARSQIGYMPQRFSLYDDLTVIENLRFFAEVRGLLPDQWRPRCLEILTFVGLVEFTERRAGFLSGGMKQKLGLAAALVHHPRVLLLDEPTTGVDPVTRQDFWQLIIRLVAQDQVAVLVSTPYMDEAARCARVGFMQHGRLVVEGTPTDLRARLNGRILELRGSPLSLLRSQAQIDADVEDSQMFGDLIHLRVRPGQSEQVISRLSTHLQSIGAQDVQLQPVSPQLEDIFIALLKEPHA
jgi:ABC-2 type transport system ATP-binding protein